MIVYIYMLYHVVVSDSNNSYIKITIGLSDDFNETTTDILLLYLQIMMIIRVRILYQIQFISQVNQILMHLTVLAMIQVAVY